MNREQRLRNLIYDKYSSLRQFAIEADIPYSTLMTLREYRFGTILRPITTLRLRTESLSLTNQPMRSRTLVRMLSTKRIMTTIHIMRAWDLFRFSDLITAVSS